MIKRALRRISYKYTLFNEELTKVAVLRQMMNIA